jgi:hypothetical protein
VTLVLRADQKFDLSLAGDVLEDRNIEDFELFPQLLEAIAQGSVQKTYYSCALTGASLGHDVRVVLADGRSWGEPRLRPGVQIDKGAVLQDCIRFLPYRR